jgi:hypothetical protein
MQIVRHGHLSPGFSEMQTVHFCAAVSVRPAGVLGFAWAQAASSALPAISKKTSRAEPAVLFIWFPIICRYRHRCGKKLMVFMWSFDAMGMTGRISACAAVRCARTAPPPPF